MTYEVIQSENIFSGRVFDVRRDEVRLPNGKTARLDVVAHHGAVTLVPVDDEGQVWFIRQYRHPAGRELLELPAGVAESGEDPRVSADRELREEIGMKAANLELLGRFFLAPGYSTEYMHVFLATGLSSDPLQADEDEFLTVEKISFRAALHMAESGQIEDSKTLAALLLARPHFL